MNIKRLIKSLLLIFVAVSCVFLVYKEFYPKSESNVTNAAETQRDKSSVPVETQSDKGTLPSTEVITHPINGWLDGLEPSQRWPATFF